MIKKIIILLLIVLLIALSLLLFKKDDKYKLPRQYKIEIQKVIDEQTLEVKNMSDESLKEANNLFDKFQNDSNAKLYKDEYLDKMEYYKNVIRNSDFVIYNDMIKITEKYANLNLNIPSTDDSYTLENILEKYLKANDIKTGKLIDLAKYNSKSVKKIDNYYEIIRKYGESNNY